VSVVASNAERLASDALVSMINVIDQHVACALNRLTGGSQMKQELEAQSKIEKPKIPVII